MKILFVDDDAIARKSIVNRVPWERYGWELIYCAKDGIDALEFIQSHQPDLILSDIKMPIMDGIQMAIIAKDYYPDVKFLFLSGYKDFEYAQQALKLNAIDYLTKPVMTENLVAALSKAENIIRQEKKVSHIMEKGYPTIQRHFISQLMRNNFSQVDSRVFQALGIDLSKGLGIVGFVDLKSIDHLSPIEVMEILQKGCLNFNERFHGSFFVPVDATQIFFVFILNNTEQMNIFQRNLAAMQSALESWLELNLHTSGVFFYGTCIRNLDELHLSCQTAQKVRTNQTTDLLSQIRLFIQREYSNSDLTLHSIASHFNINHCYLTSLYKEKYGINLYDYLIQVRMERAAELLKSTDLKSYQIAEMTGYNNSHYFSLSFKKYYGCTVTEFKNKN